MSISKWRNYGIWKLRGELNFLESTNVQVYQIWTSSGKFVCSFVGEHQLRHYPEKQYLLIQLNKDDHIAQLKERIKQIEYDR